MAITTASTISSESSWLTSSESALRAVLLSNLSQSLPGAIADRSKCTPWIFVDVADEIGAPVSRSYSGEICFCGARGSFKEHLLVSKALPIFLAPHYFCACSDLSLLYRAYDFSSQAEVLGVPLESSGFE